MKRCLLLLLMLCLLLSTLASCILKTPDEGEPSDTVSENTAESDASVTDFCIVRNIDASRAVVRALSSFDAAVEASTGTKLEKVTDASTEGEQPFEILIGGTSRAESEILSTLGAREYLICAVRSGTEVKLVIGGKSDAGTVRAMADAVELLQAGGFDALLNADIKREYQPQTISFFGDSITTYEGVSNDSSVNKTLEGQQVFSTYGGKFSVEYTWWHRTATALSLDICVNNSYSGDRAAYDRPKQRAANLHTDAGVSPDVIVIYFGVNDFINYGDAYEAFHKDYTSILNVMKKSYPAADIFCCTILPCSRIDNDALLNNYNNAIKTAAAQTGSYVIDLNALCGQEFKQLLHIYTTDGLHPNQWGFELMAKHIVATVRSIYGE